MNKSERVTSILLRLRSEGIDPDDSDLRLLQAYIDSRISLTDLLGHARQFSTQAQYREWIRDTARASSHDMRTQDAGDQFLIDVEALIRRKHFRSKV